MVRPIERVRRAYGQMAERYAELFDDTAQVHVGDLDLITRHLSIEHGHVLDVGCGPGHLTEHLRGLGVAATGIDIVPEFVHHARAAHPGGRYELGSMQHLPVAAGSVAAILAWYSLIHLPPDDLADVLEELRRTMVPGGTLVVGFFEGDAVVAFDHKVVTAYAWPVDEFSARLRQAGFREVERLQRPAGSESGIRAHAAVAATAARG